MKSKSLTSLVRIMVLSVLIEACATFLDKKPESSVPSEEAITNLTGARASIIGAYANLASGYSISFTIFPDLLADNLAHNGSITDLDQFKSHNILSNNGYVSSLWQSLYQGINRVNYILEKVPLLSDPAFTDQKRIIAEAKFIRALLYFHLIRYWGDVPLIKAPTKTAENLLVSRTPKEQVYTLVQTDLREATPDLPEAAIGRATQSAAQALSARVALELQDYAAVAALSEAILQRRQFSLVSDYRMLFDTKNTIESIFELQYYPTSANGLAFWFFPTALGGRNEVGPRGAGSTLESAYEPGDRRKIASISPGNLILDGKTIPAGTGIKYSRISSQDDNVQVIRYAEVMLIRAEALAQIGNQTESLELLNQIRQRAGLGALPIRDKKELLMAIEQEKRVELAMEGYRWFDLIRTGRAQDVLKITDSKKLVLPIPQQEILINPNLVQNEGY
ncbi:RagB/SusD family nutrient uptake outer membrane protein [Spirosoma spitsbergense]|uniref:RagB/SusD family nutrient uptake outer membrane protein n=1 Tax=Spirosoma spitsbergense TaxID=431554 RepID=UPI0003A89708|nr:RagB/SusD family nutrient uptake outer membrane protein [Spirosoma spitsbergense]